MNPDDLPPLFVPLKREYFEAFEKGTKAEEYRPEGPRWNARTCPPGRRVTLSLGYGKARRLSGVVAAYRSTNDTASIRGWSACYGDRPGPVACIKISITSPHST